MAITVDGLELSHAQQAQEFVAGGIRWIQLRAKNKSHYDWVSIARDVVQIAHSRGAIVTINDSVDVAIESDADGTHLGFNDGDWLDARNRLGNNRILGGTVHNAREAEIASECQILDYVGIGPYRYTPTKKNLAPILGLEGITELLPLLGIVLAWGIGGIELADLPKLRATGLSGVAVSSALLANGRPIHNSAKFVRAWSES